MKTPFLQALRERVLVLDGAMGTMLQERGLKAGQSPEELNLTMPEVVAGIHREYLDAGADIIVTNTFGGNRPKLAHYGLEEKLGRSIAAVSIAREVVGDKAYVAACLAPTGRFVEPLGDLSFEEIRRLFREQAQAVIEAGVDAISFETFLDIKETPGRHHSHPGGRSGNSDYRHADLRRKGRSVLGTPPEAAAITLEAAGADIVGSNCGLGVDGIYEILSAMRRVTRASPDLPGQCRAPQLKDGKTFFPATLRT